MYPVLHLTAPVPTVLAGTRWILWHDYSLRVIKTIPPSLSHVHFPSSQKLSPVMAPLSLTIAWRADLQPEGIDTSRRATLWDPKVVPKCTGPRQTRSESNRTTGALWRASVDTITGKEQRCTDAGQLHAVVDPGCGVNVTVSRLHHCPHRWNPNSAISGTSVVLVEWLVTKESIPSKQSSGLVRANREWAWGNFRSSTVYPVFIVGLRDHRYSALIFSVPRYPEYFCSS